MYQLCTYRISKFLQATCADACVLEDRSMTSRTSALTSRDGAPSRGTYADTFSHNFWHASFHDHTALSSLRVDGSMLHKCKVPIHLTTTRWYRKTLCITTAQTSDRTDRYAKNVIQYNIHARDCRGFDIVLLLLQVVPYILHAMPVHHLNASIILYKLFSKVMGDRMAVQS